MSHTLSIDVVGPSYWSYMATVMAECLDEIWRSKRIQPERIPQGVYRDAERFFGLVMQSVRTDVPENPPASLNAYVIAAYALKDSCDNQAHLTLTEVSDRLGEYSEMLSRLNKPAVLSEQDASTARDLKLFFQQLAQAGEAEIYERTVDLEPALTSYH